MSSITKECLRAEERGESICVERICWREPAWVEVMAALSEIDPKRALELAAPWKWHQELPAEIAALLEQRVSGRGSYSVFGAVPLEGQQEFVGPILRYLTLDSRSYRAFVYGRRLRQISQPQLTFHGVAINDALAVHEAPVHVLGADQRA